MKANELRIGNYVNYKNPDYENIPRKINHTSNPNIVGLERVSVNRIEYNQIEPIPLTEEWLLKFNFKEVKKDQWRFVNRLVIKRNDSFFDYASEVELKYVHKLQNFFFETSTELTLNK